MVVQKIVQVSFRGVLLPRYYRGDRRHRRSWYLGDHSSEATRDTRLLHFHHVAGSLLRYISVLLFVRQVSTIVYNFHVYVYVCIAQ